jgi:hypothetical protein
MKTILKKMAPRNGLAATLIVALAAFAAGVLVRDLPRAAAEVREEPTPKAFLSGSERSEVVLKEMLATLNKMDGRLKHFEDVLDQAARR